MARITHVIQLTVSLAVLALFLQIYPGVMVLVATAVALVYVAATIGALRGNALANRIALAFTVATAGTAALAVLRFARGGFDYLSGNFEWHDGIYWTPYAFLAVGAGATLVVVLCIVSWRSGSRRENQS